MLGAAPNSNQISAWQTAYAIPSFELFMSNWEKLVTKQPHLKLFIKKGLHFAYIHYKKMDWTSVYVICMCKFFLPSQPVNSNSKWLSHVILNPKVKLNWIEKNWDDIYKSDAISNIKTIISQQYSPLLYSL